HSLPCYYQHLFLQKCPTRRSSDLILSRAKEKSEYTYGLFIRRMVILAGVGIFHHLINPGEALLVYAIMGMPVLFLDKIPKKINLILGIAGIIIGSYVGNKILITLPLMIDRKSTRLNSSHVSISYAVFCLKKK